MRINKDLRAFVMSTLDYDREELEATFKPLIDAGNLSHLGIDSFEDLLKCRSHLRDQEYQRARKILNERREIHIGSVDY